MTSLSATDTDRAALHARVVALEDERDKWRYVVERTYRYLLPHEDSDVLIAHVVMEFGALLHPTSAAPAAGDSAPDGTEPLAVMLARGAGISVERAQRLIDETHGENRAYVEAILSRLGRSAATD